VALVRDVTTLVEEIEKLHQLAQELKEEIREAGTELPHGADGPGGPPPEVDAVLQTIMREVADEDARQQGVTVLFALLEHEAGELTNSIYSASSEVDVDRVLVADEELARFCTGFSNPARLQIMRALAKGPLSSSELTERTGLAGGQLYHHLRELTLSGLVEQSARNSYSLSPLRGKAGYLGINLLAKTISRMRIAERTRGPVEDE
jgi:DNA-binding transcriptional ArsR family regulator